MSQAQVAVGRGIRRLSRVAAPSLDPALATKGWGSRFNSEKQEKGYFWGDLSRVLKKCLDRFTRRNLPGAIDLVMGLQPSKDLDRRVRVGPVPEAAGSLNSLKVSRWGALLYGETLQDCPLLFPPTPARWGLG